MRLCIHRLAIIASVSLLRSSLLSFCSILVRVNEFAAHNNCESTKHAYQDLFATVHNGSDTYASDAEQDVSDDFVFHRLSIQKFLINLNL